MHGIHLYPNRPPIAETHTYKTNERTGSDTAAKKEKEKEKEKSKNKTKTQKKTPLLMGT